MFLIILMIYMILYLRANYISDHKNVLLLSNGLFTKYLLFPVQTKTVQTDFVVAQGRT